MPTQTKEDFWSKLDHGLSTLPQRTCTILGIDANGHMGNPPHPPACGIIGAEIETDNGRYLADICNTRGLDLIGTLRRGQGQHTHRLNHRIDYLAVSSWASSLITQGGGRDESIPLAPPLVEIDHWPVSIHIKAPSRCAGIGPDHASRRPRQRKFDGP